MTSCPFTDLWYKTTHKKKQVSWDFLAVLLPSVSKAKLKTVCVWVWVCVCFWDGLQLLRPIHNCSADTAEPPSLHAAVLTLKEGGHKQAVIPGRTLNQLYSESSRAARPIQLVKLSFITYLQWAMYFNRRLSNTRRLPNSLTSLNSWMRTENLVFAVLE